MRCCVVEATNWELLYCLLGIHDFLGWDGYKGFMNYELFYLLN